MLRENVQLKSKGEQESAPLPLSLVIDHNVVLNVCRGLGRDDLAGAVVVVNALQKQIPAYENKCVSDQQ